MAGHSRHVALINSSLARCMQIKQTTIALNLSSKLHIHHITDQNCFQSLFSPPSFGRMALLRHRPLFICRTSNLRPTNSIVVNFASRGFSTDVKDSQNSGKTDDKEPEDKGLVPDSQVYKEYLLLASEVSHLPTWTRRDPNKATNVVHMFRKKHLEMRAVEKWGSLQNLGMEKELRRATNVDRHDENPLKSKPAVESFAFYGTDEDEVEKKNPFSVVAYAISLNALNCVLKMAAWIYTGSHSMFAEFIHSLADTANQVILYVGIRKSLKEPDLAHPYGFAKIRNITSLMSGMGIFFLGAGLNIYHGVIGIINPGESSSLYWALAVLATSFVTEGATLVMALQRLMENSNQAKMSLSEYISRGIDPTTNVVLMEDSAAVLGTVIAASCISIAHFTPYSFADPVGSLLIGSLLGGVASFIISTNVGVLVGRSIPADKRTALVAELERNKMIKSAVDVKATEAGGKSVKFKAEVNFDGREITNFYLKNTNDEDLLKEMQEVKTPEDAKMFLLHHGERIVNTVGVVIDNIEMDLKKRHPEIKHCDLEQS